MTPGPTGPPRAVTTALVSGGKDSIYAAYLASTQGWPVRELLVMEPQETDSWMFHTPNLALVDRQAEAMGVPVRRVPVGASGPEAETRALADALREGAPGPVSVGAIASSFQWRRVIAAADAARRRVYAPLWRVDPMRVVSEEIAAGLDIRLVQVAAEGLGEGWLGRRLDREALAAIAALAERGPAVHPAGEGGEFETVVLDAPFFRRRLVPERSRIERRGPWARWTIERARTEAKGTPRTR
ncbi:MAG: diphthine--ammonia ligase [Thermoplasmata archaeon]